MNPDRDDHFERAEYYGALETEACIGARIAWWPTWLDDPTSVVEAA